MSTLESTDRLGDAASGSNPPGGLRPGSGAMFDRIAHRYDLVNDLMTFGLDRGWRRSTVRALRLGPGARVLDLATGTGAMALEVIRQHADASVVGVDPSAGMLALGREKVKAAGWSERIDLRQGEAESLAFDDDSFDGVCMGYGIRNVADRAGALREIARVLRPGGRVAILEATEARRGLMAFGARVYVHHVMPRIGALLSGASEYRYLQSSIAAFPPPDEFADMMAENGLRALEVRPITFGANTLFVGAPPSVGTSMAGPDEPQPAGEARKDRP